MGTTKADIYLFETIERISRFFIHLEDLDKQFYSNEKNVLRDKGAFIASYEQCLEKLIEIVISLGKTHSKNKTKKSTQRFFEELESVNITIKNLESKLLIHLPRPTEPVELRRFCRVIYKQIIKLNEKNKNRRISIYVNESSADNVYASDPLEIFKQDEINSLITSVSKFAGKVPKSDKIKPLNFLTDDRRITTIHISIPRIEANNPCHWPTLIHEVSHNLMKDDWFNGEGIYPDFLKFLKRNGVEYGINEIVGQIDLKSWLIECWCDLFACALIGPSFYFSQYSTFIHSLDFNDNKKYPPNLFRLKLVEKFLQHRFKNLTDDAKFSSMISECEELIIQLDKNNNLLFLSDSELANLFILFNQYFLHEFFILENGLLNFKNTELSTLFDNISSFVNRFELQKLNKLAESLDEGFPIASYREPTENNPLLEKPNYVQEIFLASWMFRNSSFRKKIINEFKALPSSLTKDPLIIQFKSQVVKEFLRLDQSILRSIQISEWVDLFVDDEPQTESLRTIYSDSKKKKNNLGLLVDKDIYQYLENDSIKVIPLINISKQLGSTSLDIRLGTSFEVFFPNQFGIVDFTDSETRHNIKYNSKKINLDYLEHIPINPGQFMLGHSMEYLKLPDQISADLEGRSSFARLGIEIHMTAGFVDPGFEGVLTFEIFNAGTNPVMLYPGLRIGQLRFMTIAKPNRGYAKRRNPKYSGRLEHHFSLHGEDYEVNRISAERTKNEKNVNK